MPIQEHSRDLPFLPVLAHAHAPSVPGRGVAAGALPHLEADATGGAAGRPRGPGSPASVPAGEDGIQYLRTASSVKPHLHLLPRSLYQG